MVRSVVATGKVEPVTKVEVKSKANGIIEKLNVDVDQVVPAGAVLAELDKEQLRARVRELDANLLAKRAALAAAEAQLKKNTIEAESPDVNFARRNFERAKSLNEQKLLAASALDDATSALEMAENRQRAAQGQLVVSRARVTEAQAAVAEASAAVERAQEDLANSTIKAPIRATVLTRDVELGSPVSSILNLGAEKDNVTTFEVKVSVINGAKQLKANMTANAEIVLEEHPDSLIVPEAAITYDAQRNPTVEMLDPVAKTGRRKVVIKTGIGNGTKTQVISGLKQGDKVILP